MSKWVRLPSSPFNALPMEANGTPVIAGVPFGIRPDISKSVMRGDEGEARECSQAVYGGSDRHAVYHSDERLFSGEGRQRQHVPKF